MSTTAHAVEGIGLKTNADPDREFNPRLFHRGIADLQEIIYTLNAADRLSIEEAQEMPDDLHNYNADENEITIDPDTALETAVKAIPDGWDVTVVVDQNDNYSGYAGVAARLDCGDNVEIWITIYIMGHYISKADFTVTDPTDPTRESVIERQNMSLPESRRYVLDTIRALESHIVACYANNISSAARAFDYAMNTSKPANERSFGYGSDDPRMNQSQWADARQKTRQTITNNISNARDDLMENGVEDIHGDPMVELKYTAGNALVQGTEEDKEEAFIVYT